LSVKFWQERTDLAAALRLAAYFNLHEGVDNHFSYAVPDTDDWFLMNPYGLHWSEVRARDLLLLDAKGNVIEGEGEVETSAISIHAPVHRAHRRARCVLHTHMPYATALTSIEDGQLEPVSQNALRYHNDVAYDRQYNGLANEQAEGERLAAAMGDKRVLFMENHGVLVVGESIAAAFDDLYFLERACQVQVLAMSTGRPLKRVTGNMAATFGAWPGMNGPYAQTHFTAMKRLLDRDNPGYAD
jgi:ribulose-5-phosphate 4-epimerase/fuculose-1-phosphate aldolase